MHDASASGGVQEIQTHLSHVFLTGDRVYKLRKAVDLGFVSFASRAERNADCLRELRLNRRLAPSVYLGIAPVLALDEGTERAGYTLGEPVADPASLADNEHCVVMRRLREGTDALARLEANRLESAQLDRLAVVLAGFHGDHRIGPGDAPRGAAWITRASAPLEANAVALGEAARDVVEAEAVAALAVRSREALRRVAPVLVRRRDEGRVVDGHGDLHLDHVWLETDDADPLVIDCLEFSDELRIIDAASDVAFLAMDLEYRGRGDLAEHFLARYARESADYGLYAVVDFFASYRAAVRAKVASIVACDPAIPDARRAAASESARRHLALALRLLEPSTPGPLILVGGLVGSGKSTVARALAEELRGVVVATDVVRQERPGPSERGWQRGRYTDDEIDRSYEAVLEAARHVAASGRAVLLDASWSRRERRERARRLARDLGSAPLFVETLCPREHALERLAARSARGVDPSEAGPEIYDRFADAFEPVLEWPASEHWQIDTGREDWRPSLRARAASLARP